MATDTTDTNGYFEFTYSNPVYGGDIYISDDGGVYSGFISNIPIKNIDSLNVFGNPTYNLNVKLNAQKAYTSSDTLEINDLTDGNKPNKKIAGPFTSGLLYNAPKVVSLNVRYYDSSYPMSGFSSQIGYNFNKSGWQVKKFLSLPCSSTDVVVDIQ